MTPERFRQIEELYRAARERTGDARAVLLAQADPELRRAVESMLAQSDLGESLQRPAPPGATESENPTVTMLTAGARLGPYRIEGKLGEGGMGEVFRAVDTRLGRAVAVKVAHERFGARFEREARAISSLNHPNICTLHDVGPNYLVMELVEGETIAARLKRGPVPWKTALLYASQIAAALAEAHGKGIVHRDLKPGNIMIAKSGVKVLDFGLAKSEQDETLTVSRMLVGTPAYMAPEQREGKPADARTDIYSFGCVLYEMLTGGRIGAAPKPITPRRLEKIVNRCLEEDPGHRWQSAAELERELGKVAASAVPWKALSAAAAVLVIAVAGAYAYFHRTPKLTDRDTIVLADFDNRTGDPVFDDTLRQGLAVELQQSPFLSLISDTRVRGTLALMGQPKDARLTPELARQICERTASAAVLEGSIAGLGSQYVLGLRARNCDSGAILDEEQIQVAQREDVLNSLSEITRKFRARVGESLATVERHSTPLASATTSSPEALKAYSTGMKVVTSSGNAAAIPFFKRAIELDPKFAMAYANLGLSYSTTGESVLSAESTAKAWQLRDRVSDRERFFIEWGYERQVTGNLEKTYQVLDLWGQTYPRDWENPNPQSLLAGLATHGTGRFERTLEAAKLTIANEPDLVFGYTNLATGDYYLDRFDEAERALQQASERNLGAVEIPALRFNIAFQRNDKELMDRIVAQARGVQEVEHEVAHAQALVLARSGRLGDARQLSARAVDLARQEGKTEELASYEATRAVWEAISGNAAEGKKTALAALELSQGRDIKYAAGLALALSGDLSGAEAIANDLEKRFPEDTFATFTYVPVLRGSALLARGQFAASVEALQTALRYEFAVNGLNFNRLYMGGLHSAYIRGAALLAERRYAGAAAEFQKILDHRGLVGLDPIGALAHLQLGRTYAQSGDTAKAKNAYQDFLTLWQDADPGIPILNQAKTEYAKLP